MNAFTTKEYTAYYTRLPAGSLELGIEILGDVLTAPALRELDEVEPSARSSWRSSSWTRTSPRTGSTRSCSRRCSPAIRSGGRRAGERATVEAITPDDMRRSSTAGTGPAMVVTIAGAVDHDAAVAAVAAPLHRLTGGGGCPCGRRPTTASCRWPCVRRGTEQAHLALGYRAVARTTPTAKPST